MPQLPLPSKIDIEIGDALDRQLRYEPGDASRPEEVDRCYEEITSGMQATLDRLRGV